MKLHAERLFSSAHVCAGAEFRPYRYIKLFNPQQLAISLAAQLAALKCLKTSATGGKLVLKYNIVPDATPFHKRSLNCAALTFVPDDDDPDTIAMLGLPEDRPPCMLQRLAQVDHLMKIIGIPENKEVWKHIEGPLIGDARTMLTGFEHRIQAEGIDFTVVTKGVRCGALSGDQSAVDYSIAKKHGGDGISFAAILRKHFNDYNHLCSKPLHTWGDLLAMYCTYRDEVTEPSEAGRGKFTAFEKEWQDSNATF